MTRFLWLAVFLIAGVSLSVPSGYSIGGVLMWSGGLWLFMSGRGARELSVFRLTSAEPLEREALLVTWAFFAYGAIQLFVHFYHTNQMRSVDDTVPFLLAPLLWRFLRGPQCPLDALALGISVGAVGAGLLALWQVLVGGLARAEGFTFVIQFGDLAMLLGFLSLLGLLLSPDTLRPPFLAPLGLFAGCMASLLSGSRGGWVAIVPGLIVAALAFSGHHLARGIFRKAMFALVAVALLLALVPGSDLRERLAEGDKDLHGLIDKGKTQGALNERYALIQIAIDIIPDHLWLGHSRAEYIAKRTAIVAARGYSPVINITGSHVHNDFLQALVRGGLVSFTGLCLMYLTPLVFGLRHLRSDDRRLSYLSGAAVMTVVMYIVFGLSQTFLNHNSGRMMFAILVPAIFVLRANLAGAQRPGKAMQVT